MFMEERDSKLCKCLLAGSSGGGGGSTPGWLSWVVGMSMVLLVRDEQYYYIVHARNRRISGGNSDTVEFRVDFLVGQCLWWCVFLRCRGVTSVVWRSIMGGDVSVVL